MTKEELAAYGITQVTYNGWNIRYYGWSGKIAFNVRPVLNEEDVHYPAPKAWPNTESALEHARHMIDTVTVVELDTIVYRR